MTFLASGIGLMISMILAEMFFLQNIKKEDLPWNELMTNINSGHVFMWLFRGLEGVMYVYVLRNFTFDLFTGWHLVPLTIFGYILWDFLYYWSHRMHHTLPFLWNVHVVHHQAEHFSLSMAIRNSWFSPFTSFPFFAVLAILGLPFEVFFSIAGLNYFIQFYNHNAVVGKSGFLEKFMITPAHHRVHHGCNDMYIDKNHGGSLVIWDKMFGTFQEELPEVPIQYGLKDAPMIYNPFWANISPFFKYLKLDKLFSSKEITEKVEYRRTYLFSGTLSLFGVFILYIFFEGNWDFTQMTSLFFLLLSGTIVLGSMANGSRNALWFWIGIMGVLLPIWVWYFGDTIDSLQIWVPLVLLSVHGWFGMREFGRFETVTI